MPNLVDANRRRAQYIAGILVSRMDKSAAYHYAGSWAGYDWNERLQGDLIEDGVLRYYRKSAPAAQLVFRNLTISGKGDAQLGDETVVDDNKVERHDGHIQIPAGTEETTTIEHEFRHTVTLDEAFKQGLSVSLREAFSIGAGGAKLEAASEQVFKDEWEKKRDTSDDTRDLVRHELHVQGPKNLAYTLTRSTSKVQREVTASADYEYRVELYDKVLVRDPAPQPTIWDVAGSFFGVEPPKGAQHARLALGWNSMAELKAVLEDDAPLDHSAADLFRNNPHDSVYLLDEKPPTAAFTIEYETVQDHDFISKEMTDA